jgi:hypothetical protein
MKKKKKKKSLDKSCRPSTNVSYTLALYSTPSSDQSHEVHRKLFFIKALAEIFVTRFVFSVAKTLRRERRASQHAVEYCRFRNIFFISLWTACGTM